MRFSRRSRSFSRTRSKSLSDTTSVSRCAVTHLFNVDRPTPKSDATCFLVSPLVSAIRTASARNSSVRFSPIVRLLCCNKCYQRSGIKPRQVQRVPRPNTPSTPRVLYPAKVSRRCISNRSRLVSVSLSLLGASTVGFCCRGALPHFCDVPQTVTDLEPDRSV